MAASMPPPPLRLFVNLEPLIGDSNPNGDPNNSAY